MKIQVKIFSLVFVLLSQVACTTDRGVQVAAPIGVFYNASSAAKGVAAGSATGAVLGAAVGGAPQALTFGLLGAFAGGVYGAHLDRSGTVVEQLSYRNVSVVQYGDAVRLVIPSSQLFYYRSASLTAGAKATLDRIVTFVAPLTTMSMQIKAFSGAGEASPDAAEQALLTARAHSVSRYLWQQGVNTRLMVAMGSVESDTLEVGSVLAQHATNFGSSRIEITFQDFSNS